MCLHPHQNKKWGWRRYFSIVFCWPFQSSASLVDPYCYWYLTFVFVMLICLFLEALWSPDWNGLTSWLFCVLRFLGNVFYDHLLEIAWPLGSFVCCVFLTMCFVITYWKWADLFAHLCVAFSWQCVLWSPTGNGLTSWLLIVLRFLDNVFCDQLLEMRWPLCSFVCCVFSTMCFVITCRKCAGLLALLCVAFPWHCVLWSPTGNWLTSSLICVLRFLGNVFCDHLLEIAWPLGSFVRCIFLTICFVITCWKWTDLLALLCVAFSWQCIFVTFPYGFPGQMWYLIVSIPDLCVLLYFVVEKNEPWREISNTEVCATSKALDPPVHVISLRMRAVWSEPLLIARISYDC